MKGDQRFHLGPQIQEEQRGLCSGRETVDQLCTLAGVLEGTWEFVQPVEMCFVHLTTSSRVVNALGLWSTGSVAMGHSVPTQKEFGLHRG